MKRALAVARNDGCTHAVLAPTGPTPEWDANFPGYRRCYVNDPFGNRLEFLQRQP